MFGPGATEVALMRAGAQPMGEEMQNKSDPLIECAFWAREDCYMSCINSVPSSHPLGEEMLSLPAFPCHRPCHLSSTGQQKGWQLTQGSRVGTLI